MVSKLEALKVALAAWRDTEQQLAEAIDGRIPVLEKQLALQKADFQRLSTEYMVDRLTALHEAERRRAQSTPSTLPFHEAARDTQDIAAEIWEASRSSDEETPRVRRPN